MTGLRAKNFYFGSSPETPDPRLRGDKLRRGQACGPRRFAMQNEAAGIQKFRTANSP